MKIALIGNQNNNFFALLRYFKDLNLDVTLFLFNNEADHFLPVKDTHNITFIDFKKINKINIQRL